MCSVHARQEHSEAASSPTRKAPSQWKRTTGRLSRCGGLSVACGSPVRVSLHSRPVLEILNLMRIDDEDASVRSVQFEQDALSDCLLDHLLNLGERQADLYGFPSAK